VGLAIVLAVTVLRPHPAAEHEDVPAGSQMAYAEGS
jgi:hypothetical protein